MSKSTLRGSYKTLPRKRTPASSALYPESRLYVTVLGERADFAVQKFATVENVRAAFLDYQDNGGDLSEEQWAAAFAADVPANVVAAFLGKPVPPIPETPVPPPLPTKTWLSDAVSAEDAVPEETPKTLQQEAPKAKAKKRRVAFDFQAAVRAAIRTKTRQLSMALLVVFGLLMLVTAAVVSITASLYVGLAILGVVIIAGPPLHELLAYTLYKAVSARARLEVLSAALMILSIAVAFVAGLHFLWMLAITFSVISLITKYTVLQLANAAAQEQQVAVVEVRRG